MPPDVLRVLRLVSALACVVLLVIFFFVQPSDLRYLYGATGCFFVNQLAWG